LFVAVDLKSTKFVGVRDEKMENATKMAESTTKLGTNWRQKVGR